MYFIKTNALIKGNAPVQNGSFPRALRPNGRAKAERFGCEPGGVAARFGARGEAAVLHRGIGVSAEASSTVSAFSSLKDCNLFLCGGDHYKAVE